MCFAVLTFLSQAPNPEDHKDERMHCLSSTTLGYSTPTRPHTCALNASGSESHASIRHTSIIQNLINLDIIEFPVRPRQSGTIACRMIEAHTLTQTSVFFITRLDEVSTPVPVNINDDCLFFKVLRCQRSKRLCL